MSVSVLLSLHGGWLSSPSCPTVPILSPMLAPSSSTLVLFGSNGESLLATLLSQPRALVWMGVGGPGVWDSSVSFHGDTGNLGMTWDLQDLPWG